MAIVEEGITFDLEKNAQVNRLTSSYDPKLRLREKILFLKKLKKVGFIKFLVISMFYPQ